MLYQVYIRYIVEGDALMIYKDPLWRLDGSAASEPTASDKSVHTGRRHVGPTVGPTVGPSDNGMEDIGRRPVSELFWVNEWQKMTKRYERE